MTIVLIFANPNPSASFDRTDLELIEGETFSNLSEVHKRLLEINPNGNIEDLTFQRLYEFTTDWNDSDDEDCYVFPKDTFMSYVIIK